MDGYNTPKYRFALREDLKDDKRFLPTRAEPFASGWDVRAAMPDKSSLHITPLQHVKIPLGIRGFCPEGWWYELKPRSSTFAKKNLHALYGTIDETYEGELIFACQYIPPLTCYIGPSIGKTQQLMWETYLKNRLKIDFGDAIGQILPVRREEMEVIGATNEDMNNAYLARAARRDSGGFGSTGK